METRFRFSRFVNEQGRLYDDAKKFIDETFTKEVRSLLRNCNTENELRIMGSVLVSIIGEAVSQDVQKLNK